MKENIFIALCGKSPAVITETIQALSIEHPPFIPRRVICLTTVAGAVAVKNQLFESGVWHDFEKKYLFRQGFNLIVVIGVVQLIDRLRTRLRQRLSLSLVRIDTDSDFLPQQKQRQGGDGVSAGGIQYYGGFGRRFWRWLRYG